MLASPSFRSEVVPQAEADLALVLVVELVLFAHAVGANEAEADEVGVLAAPLPAGFKGDVAAEIVFLPQMGVDGGEGRAGQPVSSWLLNSAPN